jgi:hypothetical protein
MAESQSGKAPRHPYPGYPGVLDPKFRERLHAAVRALYEEQKLGQIARIRECIAAIEGGRSFNLHEDIDRILDRKDPHEIAKLYGCVADLEGGGSGEQGGQRGLRFASKRAKRLWRNRPTKS